MLQQLRQAREDSGLSQAEVAAELKQSQNYVSKCETGDRRMDPIDLMFFARLYQKPYEYFLPDLSTSES